MRHAGFCTLILVSLLVWALPSRANEAPMTYSRATIHILAGRVPAPDGSQPPDQAPAKPMPWQDPKTPAPSFLPLNPSYALDTDIWDARAVKSQGWFNLSELPDDRAVMMLYIPP